MRSRSAGARWCCLLFFSARSVREWGWNKSVTAHKSAIEGGGGKNITSNGNSLDLTEKAQVGGSLITINGDADLDGHIHRDLLGMIRRTHLDGGIGGQMWLRGRNL